MAALVKLLELKYQEEFLEFRDCLSNQNMDEISLSVERFFPDSSKEAIERFLDYLKNDEPYILSIDSYTISSQESTPTLVPEEEFEDNRANAKSNNGFPCIIS